MSYSGYRVKIGNTEIKNTMMAPETYQMKPVPRLVGTWTDGDQKNHRETIGTKHEISFTIRERTMTEQAAIAPIFSTTENLSVTYWDDIACTYASGTFFMEVSAIKSKRHGAGLLYLETQVNLKEY